MTSHTPSFRTRLVGLFGALALIAPVATQPAAAQTAGYPAVADADPVTALSRYLRMLSANPRDLASLTGAGRAALAVGDANAALGFYARAEEIAPRNGRIKAGLATALVQMEQPRAALKLFDEAVALGVPAGDVAADRGLANDLNGDGRRAQADYTIALRAHDDEETVRRLALSMAISGDRDGALAVLSPLLRKRDSGAERARAFVLALTGDQSGAAGAVRAAIPGPQATVMTSFMARLAKLNPAQKALAVNFGYFPSDGRSYTAAELFADARAAPLPSLGRAIGQRDPRNDLRGDTPLIPTGEALGPRIVRDDGISVAPRRRPGEVAEVLPPPHVLSAPIPGLSPVTTAKGEAETRVALAQSAGPAAAGAAAQPGEKAPRQPFAAYPPRQNVGGAAPATGTVAVAQPAVAMPTITAPSAGTPLAMTAARPSATAVASLAAVPAAPPAAGADTLVATVATSGGTSPAPGFDILTTNPAPAVVAVPVTPPVPVTTAFSGNVPVVVTAAGPTLSAVPHPLAPRVAATPPPAPSHAIVGSAAAVDSPFHTAPSRPLPPGTRAGRVAVVAQGGGAGDPVPEVPAASDRKGRNANGGNVRIASREQGEGTSATNGGRNRDAHGHVSRDAMDEALADQEAKAGKPASTGKVAKIRNGRKDADETNDAGTSGKDAKPGTGVKGTRGSQAKGRIEDATTGTGAKGAKGGKAARDAGSAKDAKAATKDARATPATPERYWVQVASGANKANLDKAWDSVKGKAPKLLAGQTTHSAPWRGSNRLLIGPFKDEAAAQAKVNALAKAGVSGIQFTTRAGADVEKVGGE